MPDEASRLLGLAGLKVLGVVEGGGEALDLEVESLAKARRCPRCGCGDLVIKERPVVRVRDLPLAGLVARLRWRKRRFSCRRCGRTHTEQHPALAARQRMSDRFRARLALRASGGGAHAEIAREECTSRYQVARAPAPVPIDSADAVRRLSLDEAHHRRGHELATVISDLDRRRVVEVLDGRSAAVVARYLRGFSTEVRAAIEVVSIDPYEPLPPGDPGRAWRRADRGRPLPPGARSRHRP